MHIATVKRRMKHPRAALGVALMMATCAVAAEPLIRHEVTPLRLKRGPQPDLFRYLPIYADRESLLFLRITVGTDGTPKLAYPVDGFFTAEQGAAAQQFGLLLHYEPRLIDGKPVEYSGQIPIRLAPADKLPLEPSLPRSVQEISELLGQRNWTGALDKINQMAQTRVKTFAGYSATQALRAALYEGAGKPIEALQFAESATRLHEPRDPGTAPYSLAPRTLLIETLIRMMRLQNTLGRYGDALDTSVKLEAVDRSAAAGQLAAEISRIREMLAADSVIATPMEIGLSGTAYIKAVRSEFGLADAPAGAITEIWVTCRPEGDDSPKIEYYEARLNGSTWTMPAGTRNCTVEISGQPGKQFKFQQSGPSFPAR
jgi:hypothetical protein